MGTVLPPAPVQPIAGLLAATPALLDEARDALAAELAPIGLSSAVQPWRQSDYYRAEMGADIWRQYVTFDVRMAPDQLADLKLRTNALEDRWRGAAGRAVNLDPGYLDLVRVVLASTKDAAHRVAIGAGLYAEATLHFVHGRFEPWAYTYPDYASDEAIAFFTRARERWRADLALKAQNWDGKARWRRG